MHDSNSAWYAVRVKSRCEKMVSEALRQKGYEEFLPLYWSRRRWSDRLKMIQLPLFSGYLFCRFSAASRVGVLATPGVVLVVGQGRTPIPIDTQEVESLRVAVNSGRNLGPWPRLEIGRTVRIEEGSLRGLEGVLLRFKGADHLILGVQLLQRAVAVELPETWVAPCNATSSSAHALSPSAHALSSSATALSSSAHAPSSSAHALSSSAAALSPSAHALSSSAAAPGTSLPQIPRLAPAVATR